MPDSGQRTEKPTKRRLDRARKEGNFPSSREFVSSVQFLGFVTLMTAFAADGLARMAHLMRTLLARAFSTDLSPASAVSLARHVIAPELASLAAVAACWSRWWSSRNSRPRAWEFRWRS
jgi:flagellar biosynthesis protein FlhB